MDRRTTLITVALAALVVGSVIGAGLVGVFETERPASSDPDREPSSLAGASEPELTTFASEDAFVEYFDDRSGTAALDRPSATVRAAGDDAAVEAEADADDVADDDRITDASGMVDGGGASDAGGMADGGGASDGGAGATTSASSGEPRYSETNVQEAALDEPDVLKTDGESVYYADHRYTSRWGETSIVDVSDPDAPDTIGSIPLSGDLLLAGDTLVVLGDEEAAGYDVSDPEAPDEQWRTDLEARLETARLYDGDLYLVLVDRPGDDPCPIEPYGDRTVACTDVVRPATELTPTRSIRQPASNLRRAAWKARQASSARARCRRPTSRRTESISPILVRPTSTTCGGRTSAARTAPRCSTPRPASASRRWTTSTSPNAPSRRTTGDPRRLARSNGRGRATALPSRVRKGASRLRRGAPARTDDDGDRQDRYRRRPVRRRQR